MKKILICTLITFTLSACGGEEISTPVFNIKETALSKKILAYLKNGEGRAERDFDTDYLTVIYAPDSSGKNGNCEIIINYFDGTTVLPESRPKTKMFYKIDERRALVAIPNLSANPDAAIRVKGDGNNETIEIDNIGNFGGQVGRMQTALRGTNEFNTLLAIMLASTEIVIDTEGHSPNTYKLYGFSSAYSAVQTLCPR